MMLDSIIKNLHIENMNNDHKYILMLLGIILLLLIMRNVIVNILYHKTEDAKLKYNVKKFFTYVILLLILFVVAYLYVIYYQYLGTLIGLFSAGLAVALKDPISNFAGWIYIFATRPFEVGDRIKIGDFSGDVIDARTTHFTMLEIGEWVDTEQSTGRVIHVPNGLAMVKEIINYTKGYEYIWDEMSVVVTFESNWKEAKYILNQILIKHTEHFSTIVKDKIKEANKKYMIFNYKYLTPIVYTKVEDSGIKLSMRFLTEPKARRTLEHKIWEEMLEKFAWHKDIELAYPTTRIYRRSEEGVLRNTEIDEYTENLI